MATFLQWMYEYWNVAIMATVLLVALVSGLYFKLTDTPKHKIRRVQAEMNRMSEETRKRYAK